MKEIFENLFQGSLISQSRFPERPFSEEAKVENAHMLFDAVISRIHG
jgi:hypothetical protein